VSRDINPHRPLFDRAAAALLDLTKDQFAQKAARQ
jgi:hypothetical protein